MFLANAAAIISMSSGSGSRIPRTGGGGIPLPSAPPIGSGGDGPPRPSAPSLSSAAAAASGGGGGVLPRASAPPPAGGEGGEPLLLDKLRAIGLVRGSVRKHAVALMERYDAVAQHKDNDGGARAHVDEGRVGPSSDVHVDGGEQNEEEDRIVSAFLQTAPNEVVQFCSFLSCPALSVLCFGLSSHGSRRMPFTVFHSVITLDLFCSSSYSSSSSLLVCYVSGANLVPACHPSPRREQLSQRPAPKRVGSRKGRWW